MRATLLIINLVIFLAACAGLEPAEDQWDQEQKEPKLGLFDFVEDSKSKLGFETKKNKENRLISSSNVNLPAIDEQSFEDFENFKAWRRTQEPGSENYQEYQDWRAYQEYRRLKAQKEAQP